MSIYTMVKKHFYQDSLKLMRVSSEISQLEGINQAFAFMATDINKKVRIQSQFISDDIKGAGPDDLILLVEADSKEKGLAALKVFDQNIMASNQPEGRKDERKVIPRTFDEGMSVLDGNLAVISVPGAYATSVTLDALNSGLNVHLFSDNVSIEDEILLKDYANEKGLIVMGPDCGTSIISGVPICFANKIRQGNVGIIGASGTGMQELMTLLDGAGLGITHGIGTGGRDLSEEVNGRSALAAINLLKNDPNTEIIALISKPPSESAREVITTAIKEAGKPAILAYLGEEAEKISPDIYIAGTVEEAVAKIIALSKSKDPMEAKIVFQREPITRKLAQEISELTTTQRTIKGLYTGGTLAGEAKFLLRASQKDIIDLGDDEFTKGAVHPMIDPSNRTSHIEETFANPEVAVLLCDLVLGYGSHENPGKMLAQAVMGAREKFKSNIIVLASVTGTDADPQNKEAQIRTLEEAGIWVFPTNQYAIEVGRQIVETLEKGDGNND